MKTDQDLKIQAYVDGELSSAETAGVAALLEKDASLQAMADSLGRTSRLLKENEPVRSLPESREFYWSKIAREIEQLEAAKSRPAPTPAASLLWRWLAPAFGVAAVVALIVLKNAGPGMEMALTEVHMATPDMGSVTFTDQEAGVRMIWIYDRSSNPFTEPASAVTTQPQ